MRPDGNFPAGGDTLMLLNQLMDITIYTWPVSVLLANLPYLQFMLSYTTYMYMYLVLHSKISPSIDK